MAYTHLSYEERLLIADRLKHNVSIKNIAKELSRSTSTISREIKNHSVFQANKRNHCEHYSTCTAAKLCQGCTSKYRMTCRKCAACIQNCPAYTPSRCQNLQKSPYVCNGCLKSHICSFERRVYNPKYAQNEYEQCLTENRSGFDLTEEQMAKLDEQIAPLIKKGQSPYHIIQTLGDEITISEATLRRIIASRQISVRNIDLRVQVKRKPRKRRITRQELARISKAKTGHLWKDFLVYMEENPDTFVVEMDCVEGIKEDHAVLLTLHFDVYHLQLAFILDSQTTEQVIKALDKLEEMIGTELFQQMLPVIKTDNGSEFADVEALERSISGGKRTRVFYCEPNRSDEKGCCEKNHTHIRYVIPKGTSLEDFTQADISLMMDHINSYKRKALGGKCPYEMARFMDVPDDFFDLLGLEMIPPLEVNLTPKLLQRKEIIQEINIDN